VAAHSGETAEVAAHLRAEGLSFPVLVDPAGRHAQTWRLRGVPTSFVIDASGRIRFVEVGYTTELGLRARLWAASVW
jgi:peroxiredoxin